MKNNNTKTLLKNVCKISKGKGLKHEKVNFTEGQNCILCGDLFTQYDTVIKYVVHKTTYNEGISSKKNTVLIPGDTTTNAWDIAKAVALDEENVLLGGSINILEFNEHCDNTFFAYYLSSKKRIDLAKLAIGSTVVHLHGKEIGNIEISYPSKEMQAKIGSFFKELDELISDYQQIRQLLKESFFHFSNKFFPLQFDKYIRVEDVASERKEMDFSNDYNHLSLTIDGLIPKTDQYNRDFLMTDKENKKFKVTRINDICYNPANLKFNVITMNQIGTGIFSPIYVTLETKNIDKLYSKYLFTSKNFIKMARKYEEGTITERIGVKSSDFLKVKIINHTPYEQKAIAKLLKEHEELLELYSDYIRLLEQTKKYYLNKIFN